MTDVATIIPQSIHPVSDKVKWLTDAVILLNEAEVGQPTQRDLDVLDLYRMQGYTVANAVKAVFAVRIAFKRRGVSNAI